MVKKYFKYLLIFLFGLFLFFPKDTFALGVYTDRFNDEEFNISSTTNYWHNVYSNFANWWNGWGAGYIRFNYSITKTSGSPTSAVTVPHTVLVSTIEGQYICDIGSTVATNSTWIGQTYSAYCPVDFTPGHGLNYINFNFDRGTGDNSTYHIWVDGHITFEQPTTLKVPDTSANDNANTNKIIAEQQKILQEQQKTNQAIGDLKDKVTSPDIDEEDTKKNIDDFINSDSVSSATDVGIQDLITLPIKLYTGLLSSANSSCNSITLSLLNNDIVFPCINVSDYLGVAWNIFDIVISAVLVFNFAKKLKEIFINFSSLETNKGDLLE